MPPSRQRSRSRSQSRSQSQSQSRTRSRSRSPAVRRIGNNNTNGNRVVNSYGTRLRRSPTPNRIIMNNNSDNNGNTAARTRMRSQTPNRELDDNSMFNDPITLEPTHRRRGIFLNRKWYDVDSLARTVFHTNQHQVPHSRRPLTLSELREIGNRTSLRNERWMYGLEPHPQPGLVERALNAASQAVGRSTTVYLRMHLPSGTYKYVKLMTRPSAMIPGVYVSTMYRNQWSQWKYESPIYFPDWSMDMLTKRPAAVDFSMTFPSSGQQGQWVPIGKRVAGGGVARFSDMDTPKFLRALGSQLPRAAAVAVVPPAYRRA